MKSKKELYLRYYLISLFVVIFDQASKILTKKLMVLNSSKEVLGDFVRLTFIKNPGMAFGFRLEKFFSYLGLGEQTGKIILTVFSIVASIVIFVYLFRTKGDKKFVKLALALILGGAIGNLIDRVLYGSVVDFVDVGLGTMRWPVFNVADSAVSIGMIILVTVILFEKKESSVAEEVGQPESSPQ